MAEQTKSEYAFNPQGLSEKELELNNMLRGAFTMVAEGIEGAGDCVGVNPRYKALALTYLEIAGMFATKMLSHNAIGR